jgi:hypothetical protein
MDDAGIARPQPRLPRFHSPACRMCRANGFPFSKASEAEKKPRLHYLSWWSRTMQPSGRPPNSLTTGTHLAGLVRHSHTDGSRGGRYQRRAAHRIMFVGIVLGTTSHGPAPHLAVGRASRTVSRCCCSRGGRQVGSLRFRPSAE